VISHRSRPLALCEITLVIILLPSQYIVTETSIILVYNFNRPIKQCELVRNQRMDEQSRKKKEDKCFEMLIHHFLMEFFKICFNRFKFN
jgi:hypothetical protein